MRNGCPKSSRVFLVLVLTQIKQKCHRLMPCSATSLSPFLKADGFKFFAAHFLLCVLLFCRFLCIFAVWSDVLQRSCAILLAYLRFGTDVTTTARGILFLYAVSSHYGVFSFLICLPTYYGLMSCALIPNF